MKRKHRAQVTLNNAESVKLEQVRRYVKQMSGYDTRAEALRFFDPQLE